MLGPSGHSEGGITVRENVITTGNRVTGCLRTQFSALALHLTYLVLSPRTGWICRWCLRSTGNARCSRSGLCRSSSQRVLRGKLREGEAERR